jgi:hypothetical protein
VYITGSDGHRAVYWKNGERVELPQNAGADGFANAFDIAIAGDDVYIAGYDSPAGPKAYAVYWKNGTRTVLPTTGKEAAAHAIAVVGSDVYVAGTDGEHVPIPVYWKNGKRFELPITGDRGKANAITVIGEDVYIVGDDDSVAAVYWKNGERFELPKAVVDKSEYADATGIVIVQ